MDSATKAEVERLKNQGNELYRQGENEAAHHKYSEAIEKDPLNAVLYANRAATLLARKEYTDAAWDSKKATELDPTYARAWGRYGTATHALAAWPECIKAWEKALECLPKTGLTGAHKTMKVQFEEGLAKAKAARGDIQTNAVTVNLNDVAGKLPWDVAAALLPFRSAEKKASSAFVVCYAYGDFKEAVTSLANATFMRDSAGEMHRVAKPGVLELLSNAVIADERVFHLTSGDFIERVRDQCIFENYAFRGWMDTGGPAIIKKEALKMLKNEGWMVLRPAITITVRIWVWSAFFRAQVLGHLDFAHEAYTRTIDLLQWGRKQWPNVGKEVRGAVFQRSFIRGIKRLSLQNMHALAATRGESVITLNELIESAKDLIEDSDSDIPESSEMIGYFLAFWQYTKGTALGILGWVHLKKGAAARQGDPARISHFETASEYYKEGANQFPEDEQHHPSFYIKYLECLCLAGKPLRETLPVSEHICRELPKALVIWGMEPHGGHLRMILEQAKTFNDKYNKKLREGKCTLDSVGVLPDARPGPMLPRASIQVADT